jgi:hypothetical protein
MAKNARKRPTGGGAADLRRRGKKALLVPLTPEVLELVHLAAAAAPRMPANQLAALAIEAAALDKLARNGIAPPEKSE